MRYDAPMPKPAAPGSTSTQNAGPPLDDSVVDHLRTDYARLPADLTVGEALAAVRKNPPKGTVIYFYAVRPDGTLAGVVPTRRLILAEPATPVLDVAITSPVTMNAAATVADACEFFILHRLLAFPVVDSDGRMLGVIDVNLYTNELVDLAAIDAREATDELFQVVGVHLEEVRTGERRGGAAGAFSPLRTRFPWLLANVGGGLVAAFLTGLFEAELKEQVALALFIPVVLALAESVAIQSVSLSLPALRAGRPTWRSVWRRTRAQAGDGLVLGVGCALLVAGAGAAWLGLGVVALCLLGGVIGGVTWAAGVGAAVPNLLRRVHPDPHVASGPIALAATDLGTLLIYFSLARALL
ncbi:magnesium transporter [Alienimonas chondri]|uniref:Magnesium transporter MgtE n=1 Tax=Alienimonas chondri TaxID=2681879 RepID=A0ABX1VKK3_9PLAN|nr:magnesium transporter [Alienimonas chondri]NNJ27935.1 Magnesium transporter MgtE [Alienimonas chondri]